MVKAIRYFDMFSGIGGFRSGLEKAGGFKCIGNCEIDKHAEAAYKAMYDTEGEMYFSDARTIDPSELGDFDLITAGFPCQSFSCCGRRRAFDDPRGTLFLEIARLIEAIGRMPYSSCPKCRTMRHKTKQLHSDLRFFCLKMFPDCYRITKGKLSRSSLPNFPNWVYTHCFCKAIV